LVLMTSFIEVMLFRIFFVNSKFIHYVNKLNYIFKYFFLILFLLIIPNFIITIINISKNGIK